MKFTKEHLEAMDLPSSAIEERIVEQERWTTLYEIVFEYLNLFYQTSYRVGSTEQQDEGPWEYEKEIECTEVRQVERLVKVWEPV